MIKNVHSLDKKDFFFDDVESIIFCKVAGVITYRYDGDRLLLKPDHYLEKSIANLKSLVHEAKSKFVLVWDDLYDGCYPWTLSDWTLAKSKINVLNNEYGLRIDGIVKILTDEERKLDITNPEQLVNNWLNNKSIKFVYIKQGIFSEFKNGIAKLDCTSVRGLTKKMYSQIMGYLNNSEV